MLFSSYRCTGVLPARATGVKRCYRYQEGQNKSRESFHGAKINQSLYFIYVNNH